MFIFSEIMEYSARSDSTLGKRKKENKPLIEDITPAEVKTENEGMFLINDKLFS